MKVVKRLGSMGNYIHGDSLLLTWDVVDEDVKKGANILVHVHPRWLRRFVWATLHVDEILVDKE